MTFGVMCETVLAILCSQINISAIKPQVQRAVGLVIVDGHLTIPHGFVNATGARDVTGR